MTEQRRTDRAKRWSKGRIRAVAWVAGGATFLAGSSALGVAPKPATADASGKAQRPRAPRQRIVIRKITRRVVITDPVVAAPVHYEPSSTSSSSTSSVPVDTWTGGSTTTAPPPPSTSGS